MQTDAADMATRVALLTQALASQRTEFLAMLAAHERHHVDQDEARATAVATINLRLEGMNQFREQLDRQVATFMTKQEAETRREGEAATLRVIIGLSLTMIAVVLTAFGLWLAYGRQGT